MMAIYNTQHTHTHTHMRTAAISQLLFLFSLSDLFNRIFLCLYVTYFSFLPTKATTTTTKYAQFYYCFKQSANFLRYSQCCFVFVIFSISFCYQIDANDLQSNHNHFEKKHSNVIELKQYKIGTSNK